MGTFDIYSWGPSSGLAVLCACAHTECVPAAPGPHGL